MSLRLNREKKLDSNDADFAEGRGGDVSSFALSNSPGKPCDQVGS